MGGWLTPGMPVLAPSALTGNELTEVDTQLANGQSPQSAAVALGAAGLGLGLAIVAAAGASQGTATQIPGNPGLVFVTVTASTEGVKLPTPATGKRLTMVASATVGNKVYPAAAGQSIGTATTATTAFALALNTSTQFIATSATKWRVLKGG